MLKPLSAALAAVLAIAPAMAQDAPQGAARFAHDPYTSTYAPIASAPVLIRGATVLTGTGERLDGADVLLVDGRIEAVGPGLEAPQGATVVDGTGKWVTPGLVDVHSHLGVYPSPGVRAHSDGNEMTNPNTAAVWAEHSVWPQDPGFAAALAGGVTSLQILPGSANLFGGRGVTLKNVAATTVQAMKFPGAPHGLKMACGENPKRVYGQKGGPATRMGNIAGFRAAFAEAAEYRTRNTPNEDAPRRRGRNSGSGSENGNGAGKRDLRLDTLAGALNGDILVHIHCYRADEMANMMQLADEFGFRIAAFHHGVEAYKLADDLAREGICGALWADWWGFKMEAFDGIQENVALVDRPANGCAIVHSDSSEGIQRLNQETAKVMASARRAGIDIAPERAITWVTANPARSMGILHETGTLEPGKMADVVVWNRDPFSSYALAEHVYIDGARVYDREDRSRQPVSDFMLGQSAGGAR
ncbi:amidohydrolase [Luteimonas yindakuii]|uniref:Amidohydrolase n=1 Tax=Luteimonas yindakuii TaxID=2565782 RepID=A0A4Z1R5R5_9GAMM|nr:amidohydrolase [Luteimonas yindakuii]